MKRKRFVSTKQSRQRELSWVLYITEGYIANIAHLQAVNAYTMTAADIRLVKAARRAAEETAQMLREAMNL